MCAERAQYTLNKLLYYHHQKIDRKDHSLSARTHTHFLRKKEEFKKYPLHSPL